MESRIKKIVFNLFRFALPVVIITFLLWQIDPEDWQMLSGQQKNWRRIGVAAGLSLLATVLSFVRWWLLVHSLSISLSLVEAIKLGAIGHFLGYVSAGSLGGDLFKGVFLAHRSPGRRIEALASIGVDRIMGLIGLLIVVSLAFLLVPPLAKDALVTAIGNAILILTPVALLGLTALVFGGRIVDWGLLLLRRVPKIGRGLFRLAEFVRIFGHHRATVFVVVVMSVIVHCLLVVSVYLIATGLFERPPTFAEHFVIVPSGLTATALPITPAGLGVFEAALNHLYKVVPAIPTTANGTLVALTYDMIRLVIAAIGVLFYWTAGREVKTSIAETVE